MGSGVACWIVPEEARDDVTIIWQPDITLASSFYFCPMDKCSPAPQILRKDLVKHRTRAEMAIIEMSLNSSTFGRRSSFLMRGFFERSIGIGIIGVQNFVVKIGHQIGRGSHTAFHRTDVFPLGGPSIQPKLQFQIFADWKLLKLKPATASFQAQLELRNSELEFIRGLTLSCDDVCEGDTCLISCSRLRSDLCNASCDISLDVIVQPRLHGEQFPHFRMQHGKQWATVFFLQHLHD